MNKMNPTEVLNDNMEFLIDYLKRELKWFGKMIGLSDSQISEMERDFIARLAFAAIIRDEKEPEKKSEKESEKSDGLPSDVINALLYVKRLCKAHYDCDECPFSTGAGLCCRLCENPEDWEV